MISGAFSLFSGLKICLLKHGPYFDAKFLRMLKRVASLLISISSEVLFVISEINPAYFNLIFNSPRPPVSKY